MKQYTTPVLQLLIEDQILSQSDRVYVTFSDHFRQKILTIENPTVEPQENGTLISVHFTQEQTARFNKNNPVDVQVNWVTIDGERVATDIASVIVGENLLKTVI